MMKLYYSPTSPYVRKVTASLIELKLADKVERIAMNVWSDSVSAYRSVNPLGKIPSLVLEDGKVLFDSPIICAYLQSLANNDKQGLLLPTEADRAQQAQLWQAAADGLTDACVLRFLELKRDEARRSADWQQRQETSIKTACAWFAQQPLAEHGFSLGTLSLATALEYASLRYSEYNWREQHAELATWHQSFSTRPSLRETAPPTS